MVRDHVKSNRLRLLTGRVVKNRYSDETCGCRITVPEDKADNYMTPDFWPTGIKCRHWEREKPTRNRQPAHKNKSRQTGRGSRFGYGHQAESQGDRVRDTQWVGNQHNKEQQHQQQWEDQYYHQDANQQRQRDVNMYNERWDDDYEASRTDRDIYG